MIEKAETPIPSFEGMLEDEEALEKPIQVVREPWDHVVTKEFLNTLLESFAVESQSDFRFLLSLVMTTRRNELDRRIVFPREAVAECLNLSSVSRCRGENRATVCLPDFVDRVLPDAKVSAPFYKWNRAQTVGRMGREVDDKLLQLRDQRLGRVPSRDAFVFARWSERKRDMNPSRLSRWRNTRHSAYVEEQLQNCEFPLQRKLMKYLHSHSLASFTIGDEEYKQAVELAQSIADAGVRKQTFRHLLELKLDPLPKYFISQNEINTARLNPHTPSLASVPTEIRRVLKPNWIELDLSSAHLAIAAKEWDIEPVMDFLRSGRKVWDEIYDYTECKKKNIRQKTAKKVFKRGVYSSVYGALPEELTNIMREEYKKKRTRKENEAWPKVITDKFKRHYVIKAVFEARNYEQLKLEERSEVLDVFGRTLEYDPMDYDDIKSVFACLAQSIELKLLQPIVDYAVAENEKEGKPLFRVLLWQHDGFSFTTNGSTSRRITELRDIVEDNNPGYPTRLEVKYPPELTE